MQNNIYIVKPNDNLYDIAKNNNTTIGILKALNNLDNNILQVGQILKLPSTIEEAMPSDYLIYTIQKGDNLFNIAKTYGITLEELINFNEKGTTLLNIGEQLLIPIKDKTTNNEITYIVKPGDTLYNLAKRFNTTVDSIKEKNNIENNMLKIGEMIIIPETEEFQVYVVRTNDTLNSIANRFNTTIDEIMRINNLLTEDVIVGQIILIP